MLHKQKPHNFTAELEVAACIIECNWEILLLQQAPHKNSPGKWLEPGWKREHGETAKQTMIREICEETGIHVKPTESKKLFKKYFYFLGKNIAIDFFHITLDSKPIITISNEHSDYTWVSPREALKMDLVEDLDSILKEIYDL